MMKDVSLHPPVHKSSLSTRESDTLCHTEAGQYRYDDDDDDDELFTPRRIWPTPPRYAARVISGPHEVSVPSLPAQAPRKGLSPNMLGFLAAIGLVIFTCSTASLVLIAMLMDSTRNQVYAAAGKISVMQDVLTVALSALEQNQTQLVRLASMLETWLKNTTRQGSGY